MLRRLLPCLAVALLGPAALASVARADTETFSNINPIAIPGTGTSGVANPYPSGINVSNFPGDITNVNVRLENLAHTYPDDLDVLLVGPNNQQRVLLMSDTGGSSNVNVDLNFADGAPNALPNSTQILTGSYRPTNFGGGDTFPGPAPPPPFAGTLSPPPPPPGGFTGSPNGNWLLYVYDDAGADVGQVAAGWSLTITTPVAGDPTGTPTTGPGQQRPSPGACANPQRGTNGNDFLDGTRFGDRLSGRRGNDRLIGRGGRDCLSGGRGRDRLSGGPGRDRLSGGPSGDRIRGGSGRDRFSGGSGNDRISSRDGIRERVNCGRGTDRVRADRRDILRRCE